MNIEIYDTNQSLHLPPEFELEASFKNPLFSKDEGSGTLPATLPGTPHNFKAFGFPDRIDMAERILQRRVRVTSGIYQRMGTASVLDASKSEGININIGFDEGEFWDKINNLSLPELFTAENQQNVINYGSVASAITEMNRILKTPNDNDEFSVFEILLDVAKNEEGRTVLYKLNEITQNPNWGLKNTGDWQEFILLDKEFIQIGNPRGYGISPFLKLGFLLEKIFDRLGYSLIENPFKTDTDLKKIVVLNNSRDAIASGTLKYSDIVPTCTVNELLDTLMAKFGAVLFVNSNDRTISIRLIRDILFESPQEDLTKYRGSEFKNYFERGKQLKLTSNKNIENLDILVTAKTDKDTFEEFVDTYSNDFFIIDLPVDMNFHYEINSIMYYSRCSNAFLIWEGTPHESQRIKIVSSGFFDWDRKEKDFDYLDLTGVDEQVPMVNNTEMYCVIPAYLTGIRNNNSILIINKETENEIKEENNSNPLAFCLSHKINNQDITFGSSFSQCPIVNNTSNVNIDLCYYGENGLFNQFMKEYDRYLRYANEKIDCEFHLPEVTEQYLNVTQSITSDNQRFLIEEMKIKIGKQSPAQLSLRSLMPRGAIYDYLFIPINQTEYYYVFKDFVNIEAQRVSNQLNQGIELKLLTYQITNNQLIVIERYVEFQKPSNSFAAANPSQFSVDYNIQAINAPNNPLSNLIDWDYSVNNGTLNKYFVSQEVKSSRNIIEGNLFNTVGRNEQKNSTLAFNIHLYQNDQEGRLFLKSGTFNKKTYNLSSPYNLTEEIVALPDEEVSDVHIILEIYRYFAKVEI